MEETANRSILSQRVVNYDSLAGLRDVSRDPLVFEECQSGLVHMQFHVHTLREDYSGCAVRYELLDVSRLDTRLVPRACLAPVPSATAAGEELEVLPGTKTIDLDLAPGNG